VAEPRRGLTADERLAQLQRDRRRVQRERMVREVAGARWQRMVRVLPVVLPLEGDLHLRKLAAEREAVIEALCSDAVFAADTALRLETGRGFLAGGDVFAYLTSTRPLTALAAGGLVAEAPYHDSNLVRPWPGPPRLVAVVRTEPPPWRVLPSGQRVVTRERLQRELIGLVGARADLFALVE
jgi:hypothetical protein